MPRREARRESRRAPCPREQAVTILTERFVTIRQMRTLAANPRAKRGTHEMIAIIDFGSQYTQLIARRIREANVYCEVFVPTVSPAELLKRNLRGVILSGGPRSVYEENAPRVARELLTCSLPLLGICYGMQLLCHELGGKVEPSQNREYGRTKIHVNGGKLFEGVPAESTVWMSHGDVVRDVSGDWEALAYTHNKLLCAVRHRKRPVYAVQFHPEVVHTEYGKQILRNFLFEVCGCQGDWKMSSLVDEAIADIRQRVGKEKVICALSGGVDSTVAATLIHKAIGDQLLCVFVNNGVLRLNEAEQMVATFKENLHFNLEFINAENRFLARLKGVADPEEKRKIIGREFIRVFEGVARKHKEIRFLAQGTLYPDVIESVSAFGGPTAKIKTHHNVGGLPKDLKFELIEPLRFLFKDEVRALGREIGVPEEIVSRQPFPGPGLAVRVIGAIDKPKLDKLRRADQIVRDEVERAGLHKGLWQYFAVLLPVQSVGVMGDARTYDNVIAIRAVESQDGMTADWAKLPHDVLDRISNRITNEVKGVNRVVFDISSKPPSTIEWE